MILKVFAVIMCLFYIILCLMGLIFLWFRIKEFIESEWDTEIPPRFGSVWIEKIENENDICIVNKCNVCGKCSEKKTEYCPNCGRLMKNYKN